MTHAVITRATVQVYYYVLVARNVAIHFFYYLISLKGVREIVLFDKRRNDSVRMCHSGDNSSWALIASTSQQHGESTVTGI
jgi:hypothetical protein